jgi:hypothetical protein
MTDAKDAILGYLRHIGAGLDPDFLREAIKVMSALLKVHHKMRRYRSEHPGRAGI